MALRVWLPLNGTLENKGLSDLGSTSFSNVTWKTDGKIGKCANGCGIYHLNQDIVSGNIWTVSAWVRCPSTWGQYNNIVICINDADMNTCHIYLSIINGTKLNIGFNNTAQRYTVNYTFESNKWYHIAASYNGTTATLYANGVLLGTSNITSTVTNCLNLAFGGRANNAAGTSYTQSGISLDTNDVRIYDHCLSAKEVKEISQGLVLHYKLDGWSGGAGENLGNTSATYSNQSIGVPLNVNGWGGDKGIITFYSSGGYNNLPYKEYHKTATGSGGFYAKTADDIVLKPNKTYTMSIYIKASRNFSENAYAFNINRGSDNHYINYGSSLNITTEWKLFKKTFTTTADEGGNYGEMGIIYNDDVTDYYVYYSGFKIEEGNNATLWCPPISEMGIDTTKITDSSGYGNDGTVIGTLSTESDSDRYEISTHYPGSSYTDTGSGTFNWFDFSQCTLSAWIKPTASVSGWSGSIGIQHNQSAGYKGFTITDYANNFRVVTVNGSYTTINSGKPLTVGEWHHCAAVLDGTNLKMYYDGSMVKESTVSWGSAAIATDMRFATGVDFPGSDEMFNGNYSDIRMYCTALSAEDILDLYHTPANIDNLGNLHGFEFVEDNENKINKNGIIINNIFSSSIINNFTQTKSTQGWTLGGNLDTTGHAILVGTAPTISSNTFYVDNDDIYEINFNINMTSPSSSGDGLFLGITSSANTIRCVYNWSSGTYTETDNASSPWNTYFVSSFKLTKDIHIKTYVVGSNVNINTIKPEATDNAVTVSVIKIKSPMSVGFRAGYNTNTTMTLEFWDPSVIKINDNIKASIKSIETIANDFIEK